MCICESVRCAISLSLKHWTVYDVRKCDDLNTKKIAFAIFNRRKFSNASQHTERVEPIPFHYASRFHFSLCRSSCVSCRSSGFSRTQQTNKNKIRSARHSRTAKSAGSRFDFSVIQQNCPFRKENQFVQFCLSHLRFEIGVIVNDIKSTSYTRELVKRENRIRKIIM